MGRCDLIYIYIYVMTIVDSNVQTNKLNTENAHIRFNRLIEDILIESG